MTQTWVALMPLRVGSRSIPGKNLRPIAGRPLFAWSLEQAAASGCFDRVVVSTDSAEIRVAVGQLFGNSVELVERSAETATDVASSESVMLEFLACADPDVLSLVQATSPLTLAEDFRAARRRFEAGNHDSLLTAVPLNRFLWSKDGTPINYDPRARPRRQDFDGGVMLENGAFYITRAAMLRQTRCRLGGSVAIHPMSQEHLLEVDEPADWDIIEGLLLRRRQRNRRYPDKLILGLVVDVDGTLTDGGMYYGPEGELLKKFDTRDAHGLASVRGHGVRVSVISGERSAAVAARMEKLGIRDYHPGVQDKAACLRQIAAAWKLDMTEIAYVGDDLTDLDCMREAGFSCCPSDATGPVRAAVDYICTRPGGAGAVREVCDLILADTVKTTP